MGVYLFPFTSATKLHFFLGVFLHFITGDDKEGKIPFQYSRTLGYRRGSDGRPEIDPEEAETVRLIYARYLEGASLGDIQRELTEREIPTAEGVKGWSRQVIQNILTSEKYIGDGIRQKTYTTRPSSPGRSSTG